MVIIRVNLCQSTVPVRNWSILLRLRQRSTAYVSLLMQIGYLGNYKIVDKRNTIGVDFVPVI